MGERVGRKRKPDDSDAFEMLYEDNVVFSPLEGDESDTVGTEEDSDSTGVTGGGRDIITRSPSSEPIAEDALRVAPSSATTEGKKTFATKTKNTLILGTKLISPKKFKGKKSSRDDSLDFKNDPSFQNGSTSSPQSSRREKKKDKRESESNSTSNLPQYKNKDKSVSRETGSKKGSRIWRRKENDKATKPDRKVNKRDISSPFSQSSPLIGRASSSPTSVSLHDRFFLKHHLSHPSLPQPPSGNYYSSHHFAPHYLPLNETLPESSLASPPRSPRSPPSLPSQTPTGSPQHSPRESSTSAFNPHVFIPPSPYYPTYAQEDSAFFDLISMENDGRPMPDEMETLESYELSNAYFIESILSEHLRSHVLNPGDLGSRPMQRERRNTAPEADSMWTSKGKETSPEDITCSMPRRGRKLANSANQSRGGSVDGQTRDSKYGDASSPMIRRSPSSPHFPNNGNAKSDEDERRRPITKSSNGVSLPKQKTPESVHQIYPPPGNHLSVVGCKFSRL